MQISKMNGTICRGEAGVFVFAMYHTVPKCVIDRIWTDLERFLTLYLSLVQYYIEHIDTSSVAKEWPLKFKRVCLGLSVECTN